MFGFQNDLSRVSPSGSAAESSRYTTAVAALPLSKETMLALIRDADVLANGMAASEAATMAIISRLPSKHTNYVVVKV